VNKMTDEPQDPIAALEGLLQGIAQQRKVELNWREQSFFSAIPKEAKTIYMHISHRSYNRELIEKIHEQYGTENILITNAPSHSGQSFTDFYPEVETKKRERLVNPVEEFLKQKSIDAVIYLCNSVCDGYQSPIFPEDVETRYHIWHAIRTAEQQQKPLMVGYQDTWCFGVRCPEREYITNSEKIKVPTRTVQI